MQNHEDEDFYLDHDFNRKEDKNGELFLDPKVSLWPQSENMVIYGHNVSSGDMFGLLDQYADKGFYQKFPTFSFDTLYERATYEIVAVVKTQILNEGEEGFRYYSCFDFETEEKMDVFRAWVKKNQLYETGQRFENGDSFVMLSTCEYSVEQGRFVVIGKKMEK